MESSDAQLFDFCIVANLRTENGVKTPFVSYRFPPRTEGPESRMKDTAQNVPLFCYPDLQELQPTLRYDSETFSFVMTDAAGGKRFGYCRRMLPPGSSPRYPECYCVISFYPCFDLFYQILDVVETRRRSSEKNVSVFAFLKAVLAHSFPQPGESFAVRVFSPDDSSGFCDVTLARPDDYSDSQLKYVSFVPLFKSLDPLKIVAVFLSLVCERRVLFTASSLTKLSACVLALTASLYPFSWQHIMVPLLPESMVDYVAAPMPFVIGILASLSKRLESIPLDDVTRVDLDQNEVFILPADAPMLQTKLFVKLHASLSTVFEKIGVDGPSFNKEIALTFLRFFHSMYGTYTRHMRAIRTKDKQVKYSFDHSSLRRSLPKDTRKFVQIFGGSQMVEQFILERERSLTAERNRKDGKHLGGLFEEAVQNPALLDQGVLFDQRNDASVAATPVARSAEKEKKRKKAAGKKGDSFVSDVDETSVSLSESIGRWEGHIDAARRTERTAVSRTSSLKSVTATGAAAPPPVPPKPIVDAVSRPPALPQRPVSATICTSSPPGHGPPRVPVRAASLEGRPSSFAGTGGLAVSPGAAGHVETHRSGLRNAGNASGVRAEAGTGGLIAAFEEKCREPQPRRGARPG